MEKLNVNLLIVEKELYHYRIPFFNALANTVKSITVCHSGKSSGRNDLLFKEESVPRFNIKNFVFQPGLRKIANQHDVVITKFDLQWLTMMALGFGRREFKVIRWGIGVSSAKGFDLDTSKDKFRFWIGKKADAIILYSEEPVSKYLNAGFDLQRLFVAHNTVEVEIDGYEKGSGSYFLFVGSIHQRKNIEELLFALKKHHDSGFTTNLKIVGSGSHLSTLKSIVTKLDLNKVVHFVGEYRGKDLQPLYKNAIATISPGQAGLSVLESIAHGVPFITRKKAITGGERFSVVNDFNGYLYNSQDELVHLLNRVVEEPLLQQTLSENASRFYNEQRRVSVMVEAFTSALRKAINLSE